MLPGLSFSKRVSAKPSSTLILNIKAIIEANPEVELFAVPRINDFKGVTPEHAKHWGWRLSPCDQITHEKIIDTNSIEYKFLKTEGYIIEESINDIASVRIKYKAVIVNAMDPQGRIYKNDPKRIRWNRRLHEKLEGYTKFTTLPLDYELSLYHDKTIEVQLQTNKRYNEWFTDEENRGHSGFTN